MVSSTKFGYCPSRNKGLVGLGITFVGTPMLRAAVVVRVFVYPVPVAPIAGPATGNPRAAAQVIGKPATGARRATGQGFAVIVALGCSWGSHQSAS